MQRLKKYSGSSTTAGTDLANDSCMNAKMQMLQNKSGSENERNFFASPHNELTDSIGFQNPSIDVSRDESQQ